MIPNLKLSPLMLPVLTIPLISSAKLIAKLIFLLSVGSMLLAKIQKAKDHISEVFKFLLACPVLIALALAKAKPKMTAAAVAAAAVRPTIVRPTSKEKVKSLAKEKEKAKARAKIKEKTKAKIKTKTKDKEDGEDAIKGPLTIPITMTLFFLDRPPTT